MGLQHSMKGSSLKASLIAAGCKHPHQSNRLWAHVSLQQGCSSKPGHNCTGNHLTCICTIELKQALHKPAD